MQFVKIVIKLFGTPRHKFWGYFFTKKVFIKTSVVQMKGAMEKNIKNCRNFKTTSSNILNIKCMYKMFCKLKILS